MWKSKKNCLIYPEIDLKKTIVIVLLVTLFFPRFLLADTAPTLEDKAISSVLKNLARAFTAMADLDRLKKDNIAKIKRMDEEKFRKRCNNICNALKDMPGEIKNKYKISREMSKEEVIKEIQSLDKKEINLIIDAAPDKMLADMFKQHLARAKQKIQSSNLVVQVSKFWDNLVKNMSVTPRR
jgi:hypothetical protein